jgi:hypothetical protein
MANNMANPWDSAPIVGAVAVPTNPWDSAPIVADVSADNQPKTWGETLSSAATNLPGSTLNVLSGVGNAIIHPIDTARSILDLGAGELSKALPDSVSNFIDKYDPNPAAGDRAKNTASAFNDVYQSRYGSMEGFKNDLAKDPAAILGDLATALTLGGGIASKIPQASKLANLLNNAGSATNPLSALPIAYKAAGKTSEYLGAGLASALGSPIATGVGSEPIKQAYKAGYAGNKDFLKNLSGQVPMQDAVNTAKQNIQNMAQQKSQAYRNGMAQVSGDKSILQFNEIDDALNSAYSKAKFENKIKNQRAYEELKKAESTINEWRNDNPATYHTPEGLDALKQRLWDQREGIPINEKSARSAIADLANATKSTITKQAPVYQKVVGEYSDATRQINEIQKTLSLTERGSADTALRKLQSLTRNNVQANYGGRAQLAKEMIDQGGLDIMPALSGQAMNNWYGRGMSSHIGTGAIGLTAGSGNPLALSLLPLQSPKLVGYGAYGLGRGSSLLPTLLKNTPDDALTFINNNADRAKALSLLLGQSQQGQQK